MHVRKFCFGAIMDSRTKEEGAGNPHELCGACGGVLRQAIKLNSNTIEYITDKVTNMDNPIEMKEKMEDPFKAPNGNGLNTPQSSPSSIVEMGNIISTRKPILKENQNNLFIQNENCQLMENENSLCMEDENNQLIEDENTLLSGNKALVLKKENSPENPFELDGGFVSGRTKRRSSVIANEKNKMKIAESNTHIPDKKVCVIDKYFCGFAKSAGRRKPQTCNTAQENTSKECQGTPSGKIRVLQDLTNSPAKGLVKHIETPEKKTFSSEFFHDNIKFLKPKQKEKTTAKKYQKLKKKNTLFNQGYKTVTPRKKSVIGLVSLPKGCYRSPKKPRLVHFDTASTKSIHNNTSNVRPILLNPEPISEFVWNDEKEKVEIIKRVDLGTDFSFEGFSFQVVEKKVRE